MNQVTGFKLFYFLTYASFSGYVMFRNVYLEEIGMSGTQMGLIGLLFPLSAMAAQPVWGVLADSKGASKTILLVSAVGAGAFVLLYPLAPLFAAPFAVIAVGTVLFSVFRAPANPIANSLVLSTGLSYEGVRAYGSIAFGLAGLALGAAIGFGGTELVFYAFSVGMVLIVLLLLQLDVDQSVSLGNDLELDEVRQLLSRQFVLLLAAAFCIGLLTPAGSAFFSVYVRAVGQPDTITGIAWLLKTVAEAIAFLYIARREVSYRLLLGLGALCYAGTYLVLANTTSAIVIVFAYFALGFGYALFNLASVNLAHVLSPNGLRATAQAFLFVGGFSAGTILGEPLAGVLLDLVGAQGMYASVAGLGVLAAAISMRIGSSATS